MGFLKLSLFLVMCLSSASSFAKSSNFNSVQKQSLYEETKKNHHSIGYNSARIDLLGGFALKQDGNQYFITDVYCEKDYSAPGPGRLPKNSVINVEHTWPQSHFGGADKGSQKSDLHHLYPSDSQLNSNRGNHPFGEVVEEVDVLKCAQNKLGRTAEGTLVFEPPAAHKGNVARALFYFSVRYQMHIDQEQEATLRKWHNEDLPDAAELNRNDAIEKIQGNRNPFIDHPELAETILDF